MEKVVVHVLDCAPLAGHEDACRGVVAPMYARRSEVGPTRVRLETLGGGLLARDVLGVTADADVSYGEYGKPRVAGGPEFNLTNDVGIVALAVAKRPVGIDLEEIPARYRDVEDLITRKYYDEAERAAVGDGSTRERRAAWARAWTRREAILKAMGTGFAVDPRKRPEVLLGWELRSVELGETVLTCAMDVPFEMSVLRRDALLLLDCHC
ncbi:4'-phosphopantetheinyl transferase family protein [Parafannyhessea umbonata]|uniref:4'-phosphopantetheinyl transferase family protein n=1 Tax=Parafannyhessea umbonata TaxID=604330 RepID=UPI00359C7408